MVPDLDKKTKNKLGRPTKFTDELTTKVIELSEQGKTVEEIAAAIGVSYKTVYNWWSTRPGFLQAVKEARDVADNLVEASLFRRACGFSHPEIKHFSHEGVVTDERIVEKIYAPDTVAAIFWLKNRRPQRWREKREVEVSVGKEDQSTGLWKFTKEEETE